MRESPKIKILLRMKKAVIYIRVSTDEQADRGYSLGVQQEQLEKYCLAQDIEIAILYREDHSAKNFNRPEFNKFLTYAKSNHRKIDYFLFVSWDRFSRNAPDAYQMIAKMKKWEIEPQAITQPIDFSVPQSKIMLSIYLTLPEVDNDIRSEKVRMGMRGANKLGRWANMAPIGYTNTRDSDNRPIIVPNEDNRELIVWAFNEVKKNYRPLDEIRRELNSKGLKIAKTSFARMVRNPAYVGKIRVKAYKNEPEEIIEAIHEGIIEESIFNEIQLILQGRIKKLKKRRSFKHRDELPLRGILCCSKCGKHVTGSASRGKMGQRYFYYHCEHCKTERYRADKANTEIELLLENLSVGKDVDKLYTTIIESKLKGTPKQIANKKGNLTKEHNKLKNRVKNLQGNFLDGDISAKDYSELKALLEHQIFDVQSKIDTLKKNKTSFSEKISQSVHILSNILESYKSGSVQDKMELLSSIFPERFTFEENKVRTQSINPAFALILKYSGELKQNKKGQKSYNALLTHLVIWLGLEPRTLSLKGRCSTN